VKVIVSVGRYRVQTEQVGSRKWTWTVWKGSQYVDSEYDPATGKPTVYPRMVDARTTAAERVEKLASYDDKVLDLVNRLYGFGDQLTTVIEVLKALVEDEKPDPDPDPEPEPPIAY